MITYQPDPETAAYLEESIRIERAERERVLRVAGYQDGHIAAVLGDYDARHAAFMHWRRTGTLPAVKAAPLPARPTMPRRVRAMAAAVVEMATAAMTL